MASLASEERSCPACRRRFASIRTLPTATAAQVNPVRGTALPAARPADERAATRRRGDSGGAARESTVAKKCEQCSSVLDRVYGSGRFCNRLCKNTWCQAEGRRRRQQEAHKPTEETRAAEENAARSSTKPQYTEADVNEAKAAYAAAGGTQDKRGRPLSVPESIWKATAALLDVTTTERGECLEDLKARVQAELVSHEALSCRIDASLY